jgi:hypothetical protein
MQREIQLLQNKNFEINSQLLNLEANLKSRENLVDDL